MKIYKKDIRRIIEILEKKEKELNEINNTNPYFETSEFGLKIVSFTIPDEYQIGELTIEEAKIIYPYLNITLNNIWDYTHHLNLYFYLEIDEKGNKIIRSGNKRNKSYFFKPEDYIEHVIKQDKNYKI